MRRWPVALAIASLLTAGCRERTNPLPAEQTPLQVQAPPGGSHIDADDPSIRSILDQIVAIVLTSPDLKDTREFYGTVDDTRCALVSNENVGIPWPEWYMPQTNGITFVRANEGSGEQPSDRRLLGIRIDNLAIHDHTDEEDVPFFGGPVQITLLNAGGDPEGVIVSGGARVYFRIQWESGKPQLVYTGLLDA